MLPLIPCDGGGDVGGDGGDHGDHDNDSDDRDGDGGNDDNNCGAGTKNIKTLFFSSTSQYTAAAAQYTAVLNNAVHNSRVQFNFT